MATVMIPPTAPRTFGPDDLKLRFGRFDVTVDGDHAAILTKLTHAKRWADIVHPVGDVTITKARPNDGWVSHIVAARSDGTWRDS